MQEKNTTKEPEIIELTLPVNSAYVSSARLTASSIANRLGFNIDEIEDIKAAVSEACILMISQCIKAAETNFHLQFNLYNNYILINLSSNIKNVDISSIDNEELGMKVIQTLMPEVKFESENDIFKISMKKSK